RKAAPARSLSLQLQAVASAIDPPPQRVRAIRLDVLECLMHAHVSTVQPQRIGSHALAIDQVGTGGAEHQQLAVALITYDNDRGKPGWNVQFGFDFKNTSEQPFVGALGLSQDP